MASLASTLPIQCLRKNKPHLKATTPPSRPNRSFQRSVMHKRNYVPVISHAMREIPPKQLPNIIMSASTAEKQKKYTNNGFVDEMRAISINHHTTEHARNGKKKPEEPKDRAVEGWEPSVEGYLKYLVNTKLIYDALEGGIEKSVFPYYAEFINTGLERSKRLLKDFEWLKEQGYAIPEPSSPGIAYAQYLKELSEKDPHAFLCHFYNIYFSHAAGGRQIGAKAAEKLPVKKELEFYQWDGDISQLLQNVRDKLNKVSESWTREEKDHCLNETPTSFEYSGEIIRLILS